MLKIFKNKNFIYLMLVNLGLISISYLIQVLRFNHGIENLTLTRLFDLNQELNIPTWYQGILLFYSAILLHRIAGKVNSGEKIYWNVLSYIFLILSMDEISSIHEDISMYVGNYFKSTGYFFFAWVIVAIPLLIILAIWLIPFLNKLPKYIAAGMLISAFTFIFGAVGMEMLGGKFAEIYFQHNLQFNTLSTIEESLEIFGITIFIATLNNFILFFKKR